MENARGGEQAPETSPPAPEAPPRRRRVGILVAVAALIYVLDLVSKLLVVKKLTLGQPVHLLGSVLQLNYTRNSGAAFSIGWSYTAIFTIIAIGVVIVIARLARKLYSVPWAIALGLLLGGALGNVTDRIFRAPGPFKGWVVDFIQLKHFAVFNLADAGISCGGVLMVLLAFRGLHPDGTDERAKYEAEEAERRAEAESYAAFGEPEGNGAAAPTGNGAAAATGNGASAPAAGEPAEEARPEVTGDEVNSGKPPTGR